MASTTITIVLDDDRNKMQVIFYRRILNKDIMDNLHQQGSTPPPITETYSMCTDYSQGIKSPSSSGPWWVERVSP